MRALTVEEIGAWERNGFLKVENFVDADELTGIRRIMEALVEQDPPDPSIHIDIDPVLADRADIPRIGKFRALMHAAHASRELLETYTLRPRTLDVVEDLIGPDIVYYTDQTFLKPPGGSGAPAHQDNAYWDVFWAGKGKLSVWLALDDSTVERGCTRFVAGSHRQIFRHDRDFSKDALFGGAAPDLDPAELTFEPVELRAGDACIHHCETIHMSGPNVSDHSRRGLVTIYFSGRCTYTDQESEWFPHRMIPARGAVYPGCVGWYE